ncbi:MAG: S41 family peptidase [Pseudomonadota bacterium]
MISQDAFAQPELEHSQLSEDLKILGEILIETSPSLSESDQLRIERALEEKAQALVGERMNVIEFIELLSEMDLDTGFDEHASMSLDQDTIRPLLAGTPLFPLPVLIVGDRLMVNVDHDTVPFGSIIHSINGEPAERVWRSLSKDHDSFSKRRIESQFSIRYRFKKEAYDSFHIRFSEPEQPSTIRETSLDAISIEGWLTQMNEHAVYPLKRRRQAELINTNFFPEQDAYYIQVNSFFWDNEFRRSLLNRIRSDDKNFEREFRRIFREVKDRQAKHLIIDLRHNEGGNLLVPGLLYSYIAREPFEEAVNISIRDFDIPHHERVVELNGEEVERLADVEKFIEKFEKEFEETDSGLLWELVETAHEPHRHSFSGKVYLLTGGKTFSASAYFAAMFKSQNRGLIVGDELGGSHQSITAGTDITYKLPNSQISVTVPLMEVVFADLLYERVPENKIQPDVPLADDIRIGHMLEKKDPELEEVLRLIGQSGGNSARQ